jgi:predicted nucleotidyltransferase
MNPPVQVKEEIIKIDPKAEVILFGSRARGDFRNDSDWDFLILLDRQLDEQLKDQILITVYRLELQGDAVFNVLIHTKNEWANHAVTPLYAIIEAEGKRA